MAKVIVPVGFDGGRLLDRDESNGAITGPGTYEIVKPTEIVDLTGDEYRIWLLSFADPEAASRCEFDRSDLENLATLEMAAREADGNASVDVLTVIDRLFKYGLLAEFDPGGTSGLDFLKTHRLFANGDGFGESEDSPGYFQVGREGRVMLKLMIDPYAAWLQGAYAKSIWDNMIAFRADSDEEPLLTEEQTMQMVAQSIPGIVTNRCGYVQLS